jgi:CHAD domain-containing protein
VTKLPEKSFKPPKAIRIYGATVMLKHLKIIIKETTGIYRADEIEHIHRTRVASRRLRTCLNAFEPYFPRKRVKGWKKTIRRVARLLSAARDTDVQLAELNQFFEAVDNEKHKPGIKRMILRLTQRRQKLQNRLVKQLKKMQRRKSLTEIRDALSPLARHSAKISEYPPDLYSRAEETILYQLDILLYHHHYISQPARVKELHDVRLIAKELRYLMEIFNPIYDDQLTPFIQIARKTQELVGQIRDRDLWYRTLAKFLRTEHKKIIDFQGNATGYGRLVPGIQHFQHIKQQEREALYAQFLRAWRRWTKEKQWDKLRQTIEDYHGPLKLVDSV